MVFNPGHILRARYKVIRQLGKGGWGRTYLAEDLGIPDGERKCVIKEITPSPNLSSAKNQEILANEAKALHNLGKHSQIPQLFERFTQNNQFYLIQEYIPGKDLSKEIIPRKRLDEKEVVQLLKDILEILQFVHEHNCIHRDLKPSNLIRSQDGKIFLIDFGAVKEIPQLTYTSSGELYSTCAHGTPGYMPPEQYRGCPKFNSDIYAVGIIGIQALTGLHPQNLHSDIDTGEIIWNYSVPGKPSLQVSHKLENILNRMVRYHFNQRYQSVAEVLKDLGQYTEPNITVSDKDEKKTVRKSAAAVLTLVAFVIAVFLGFIKTPENNPQQQTRDPVGDSLSYGEEILNTDSTSQEKEQGVSLLAKEQYQQSVESLKASWEKKAKKDPETLIYLNNALLEAKKVDYYTIAVVAPITSQPGTDIREADMAKEILRGVAQAQTEVNLGLFNAEGELPGQDFLRQTAINGKGLKVVIADDYNLKNQAQIRANSLVERKDILAVVGHSTTDMTLATVDIYAQNKLVLISPGTPTESLTKRAKKFFFSTLPDVGIKAEYLANYIHNQGQTKAAVFYNPGSPYSEFFWEEFQQRFVAKGGTLIEKPNLSQSDFDAEEAIEDLEKEGETTLVLLPDGQVTHSLTHALNLIKANNGRNLIVGGWSLYSPRTLAIGNLELLKNLVISVPWHRISSPNLQFTQNSKKLWRGDVSPRTALAYDATRTVIAALEKQDQPTRTGMQKALADPNFNTQGATGTIKFNDTGDRQNPPVVLVHVVQCSRSLSFVPINIDRCEE